MFPLKIKVLSLLLAMGFAAAELCPSVGFQIRPYSLQVFFKPIVLELPQSLDRSGESIHIALRTLDPSGRSYPVKDVFGRMSWTFSGTQGSPAMEIAPSLANYGGPVEILANGSVIDRYRAGVPHEENLILEKVFQVTAFDGTALRLHTTDFILDQIEDPLHPMEVLQIAKRAYEILARDFGIHSGFDKSRRIDLILVRVQEPSLGYPGLDPGNALRAPLFVLRWDREAQAKIPTILLPADYKSFLEVWNEINPGPPLGRVSIQRTLKGSILHEMTHAVLHAFHENLGSTEYDIRNGDWYTEGLARYYETKLGSMSGFISWGFREKQKDKIRFSRGGANFHLRYPDSPFFQKRYEQALFWFYVEKNYGNASIRGLTEKLKDLPFEATSHEYADLLSRILNIGFEDLLEDYFNWVFRGDYRLHREGRFLWEAARTRSVWSEGAFFLGEISPRGPGGERLPVLRTDAILDWGGRKPELREGESLGDLTPEADIAPLSCDYHEIEFSGMRTPKGLIIRNTGNGEPIRVTFYIDEEDGPKTLRAVLHKNREIELQGDFHARIRRIGLVLANLDFDYSARYEIEIR